MNKEFKGELLKALLENDTVIITFYSSLKGTKEAFRAFMQTYGLEAAGSTREEAFNKLSEKILSIKSMQIVFEYHPSVKPMELADTSPRT